MVEYSTEREMEILTTNTVVDGYWLTSATFDGNDRRRGRCLVYDGYDYGRIVTGDAKTKHTLKTICWCN